MLPIFIPAVIVFLAITARLAPGPRTIDDAFITFRYARNLLAGNGFVYNPGEAVLGTTTPLYTFLIAGLALPSGGIDAPFPEIALQLNTLADAATCLLLIRLGRRLGYHWAGYAAAAAWAVAPFSITFAIGGLETSLYVFLLVGSAYAALTENFLLAGLAGSFAILTRPDAVLLIGPLALTRLIQVIKRKSHLTRVEILAFFTPLLAWAIFAMVYFGSPVPHSVTAKMAVYRLEDHSALIRLLQHYATPFFEDNVFGSWAVAGGLILYPFLSIVSARQAIRKNFATWPIFAYPWIYLLVFALPNPLIFRWYLTPPLPFYFLGILAGIEMIIFNSREKSASQSQFQVMPIRSAVLIGVAFILPLFSVGTEWKVQMDHGSQRPSPAMAYIQLELLYQRAAEIVNQQLKPGEVLAAGDVGVLGFETQATILDTVGLNSPIALKYYPTAPESYVINYAIPTALILNERPDWIVVLEVYGRRTFLTDQNFLSKYSLIETINTDMYGSQGMLLFHKK